MDQNGHCSTGETMSDSTTDGTRQNRELIEIAAHGKRGQLHEDEQHGRKRCRFCGEMHLGELTKAPPDGFYLRYYCPNTSKVGRVSFP